MIRLPKRVGYVMIGIGLLLALFLVGNTHKPMTPAPQVAVQQVALRFTPAPPTATDEPTERPTSTPVPTATSLPSPVPPSATPDVTQATARVVTTLYGVPRVDTAARMATICPGSVLQGIESQRVNKVVWYHVRIVSYVPGCGSDSNGFDGWLFAADVDAPNGMAVAELAEILPPTAIPPTARPVVVQAPAPRPAPAPVAPSGVRTGARCRDGSHSNATGRGACSHHGGVAQWLFN